jgi:DNA-binding NarL/FixJ family response regulator
MSYAVFPPPQAEPIQVIVADSSRMGNQLLSSALSRDHRFKVVGLADTSTELEEQVSRCCGVLLIAADFEKLGGGFEATKVLVGLHPDLKVVLLLYHLEADKVVTAFRSGARGVFGRSDQFDQLRRCIACVYAGQIWAGAGELNYVLQAFQQSVPPKIINGDGLSLLSDRERAVVRYICDGFTNREIAERMGLSEHTVKNHLFRIYSRLGISSRVEIMFSVLSQRVVRASQLQEQEPASDIALFEAYLRYAEFSPLSQFLVGKMYLQGRGIERDPVAAYMWLTVAERNAHELLSTCQSVKDAVAEQITPEDRLAAESQAAARKTERWWVKDLVRAVPGPGGAPSGRQRRRRAQPNKNATAKILEEQIA